MRDIVLGDTFYHFFTTRAFASGVPTQLAGTPALSVIEENNATPITSGVSLSVDRASVTGLNQATIVATSGNGYEDGKSYAIYISTGTVGGVSVVGEVVGHFTVGKILKPTTAGRTLVVDAAGLADANTVKLGPSGSGTAQTARDIGASVLLSSGTGTGQIALTSGAVDTVTTVTNDVGVNEWNGVSLGTTNPLPNAAAGAAGGLPTDSAGKTSFNDIAATAIVSGGAITTSGGAVSTVTSVTNTVTADLDTIKTQTVTCAAGVTVGTYIGGTGAHALASVCTEARLSELAGFDTSLSADIAAIQTSVNNVSKMSINGYTADGGSTTTVVDAALTEADTDYWKGSLIRFTTGGNAIQNQARLITGFDPATDTITFAPAVTQAVIAGNKYEILPFGGADVRLWGGSAPNALVAGAVDADVSAVQNDAITAAAVATGAIDADALAADAIDLIWDEPLAAHTTGDTPGQVLNMLTQDAVTLSTDVALASIFGQLLDNGTAWSYDRTTDSLEAVRDHIGDGTNLTEAGGTGDQLTALATAAALATTDGKVDTAQNDLDIITGSDGVFLATTGQPTGWPANLQASASGIIKGTMSGTPSSTSIPASDLPSSTDDAYIGRVIVVLTGSAAGEATDITDYVGSTKTLTVTALAATPSASDTFVII